MLIVCRIPFFVQLCIEILYLFSGNAGHPYLHAAVARAMAPYCLKTMHTYKRQFQLYLAFAYRSGVDRVLSVTTLISFLEFLLACNISTRVLSNYVLGIRAYASLVGLPVHWMGHQVVQNYMCSVQINVPHVRKPKLTVGMYDMYQVSKLLEKLLEKRLAILLILAYARLC